MRSTVRKYANLLKNIRSWPRYLAYKMGLDRASELSLLLKPVPIRLLVPRSAVATFKEVFLLEEYEPPFRRMTADAPVVLDVGGNIGFFALYVFLRKPRARVYSFEPVPTHFGMLRSHQAAHPHFDWTALPLAVADQSGTVDFFYDETHSDDGIDPSASLFSPSGTATPVAEPGRLRVETVGLAGWLDGENIARVDLLKLDCEGAEYPILYHLPDALFPRIRRIVAEAHPLPGTARHLDALTRFLRKKGYRVETYSQQMLYAEWPDSGAANSAVPA